MTDDMVFMGLQKKHTKWSAQKLFPGTNHLKEIIMQVLAVKGILGYTVDNGLKHIFTKDMGKLFKWMFSI